MQRLPNGATRGNYNEKISDRARCGKFCPVRLRPVAGLGVGARRSLRGTNDPITGTPTTVTVITGIRDTRTTAIQLTTATVTTRHVATTDVAITRPATLGRLTRNEKAAR